MGKTRDLFKKIRDTKGTFNAKMGSIKDRNGMDLTEAEVAALNRCAGMSPQGILEGVKADVDAFTGDASQFDDLTMLCLCYKGKKETPRQEGT